MINNNNINSDYNNVIITILIFKKFFIDKYNTWCQ